MTIRHVILDRDGVLNELAPRGGYITSPAQWRWIPGALEALGRLSQAGIRASIATNQSAVGRGLMTGEDLASVHALMVTDAARHGAAIDAVMICPHAPQERCDCRKPRPGLISRALQSAHGDARETVMIGDDVTDLEASWAAGVTGVLVRTGKGSATESVVNAMDVAVFDDLESVSRAILDDRMHVTDARRLSVQRSFLEHQRVVRAATEDATTCLIDAVDLAHRCLASGHKIMACGNGGSASDAQHLVGELVGRYCGDRPARAAIALTTDGSTMTALANDYGYERVFARQVEALGRRGDILIAISTSGRSRNVIEAAKTARARGCWVIGLGGESGGDLAPLCDLMFAAPSIVTARIQELHGLFIHAFAEALDRCYPGGDEA